MCALFLDRNARKTRWHAKKTIWAHKLWTILYITVCFTTTKYHVNVDKRIYSLKGHSHEKSVSNTHMTLSLRPSKWTATIFEIFLIVPMKAKN
jgi:hypothetical protein